MARGGRPPPETLDIGVIDEVEWTPDNHAELLDKYLDKLLAYHDWATGAPHAERSAAFSAMNRIAEEIRQRGGQSDYPLTARFASSLVDFTSVGTERTDNYLKIVTAHIDAMRAIVHGGIKGDRGAVGAECYNRSAKRSTGIHDHDR